MLHVRVYNKYGLPPSARLLVAREALRMAIFWALPLVLFVQVSQWWAMPVTITVLALAGIFWLVDFGWMVFSREGKPLHDRLMETSVVLDTSVL
jgi:putative effector of murein hydrolase